MFQRSDCIFLATVVKPAHDVVRAALPGNEVDDPFQGVLIHFLAIPYFVRGLANLSFGSTVLVSSVSEALLSCPTSVT